MTELTANLELNNIMSREAPKERSSSFRTPLRIGILIAVLLSLGAYFTADFAIQNAKEELLAELQAREEITAAGKNEVMTTWIDSTGRKASQIASHPLFRLFADEVNRSDSAELPRPLANQLPYMQNAISSFVEQNNVVAAYVIGRNGRAYLASTGSPSLTDEQRDLAVRHYSQTEIAAVNARESGKDLLIDFLVPILEAQSAAGANPAVVGIMVMTVSAREKIEELLRPSALSMEGEETWLFQRDGDRFFMADSKSETYFSKQPASGMTADFTRFALRDISTTNGPLYSVGVQLGNTNWVITQGIHEKEALEPLERYSVGIWIVAVSTVLVILSILAAIWLTLRSQNNKAMAEQYKELAHKINAQRRLLGSINNTIDDLIGLTDTAGRYVYANPSLARFVNFPVQSIAGKTDRDLFGEKAARAMGDLNQVVLDTEQTQNTIMEVETDNGTRILRIEKSRLMDDEGLFMGIVTVAGDITDFIEHQRMKERLGQKTISVLVRMLEANDPYLANHSHRMSVLANNVARVMDLPTETRQAIATGANLSQIGKISIPSEIRTKDGRLTDEEMDIMRGHVASAESILAEMEVDAPIVEAVAQMYERKDGTGYPKQLEGEEIAMSARILGMADILIARISPRSYRQEVSVEEAMEVFRSNPHRYDQDVVAALDDFLQSPEGEDFRNSLEQDKNPS